VSRGVRVLVLVSVLIRGGSKHEEKGALPLKKENSLRSGFCSQDAHRQKKNRWVTDCRVIISVQNGSLKRGGGGGYHGGWGKISAGLARREKQYIMRKGIAKGQHLTFNYFKYREPP